MVPRNCSPTGGKNGCWSDGGRGPEPVSISPVEVTAGHDRTKVSLVVMPQGRDLVLTVTGGEAHVGAVAVRSPAGGTGGEPLTATVVVPGHKEGPLATEGAARLAAATGRTCVAVVGIHIDAATADEIALIIQNVQSGLDKLVHTLGADEA